MSAVDQITENMAAAHITDPATAAQNDAVSAVVDEGRRVYIGNLAYATTETELSDFFKGFLVESKSIPTHPHSNRPVGYAFVDLSTSTEAQRAISELSGQEILQRKVSVQLARKPEGDKGTANGEGADGEGRRRPSGRGRGRGRGRGGRSARGGRSDAGAENSGLPLTDATAEAANEQNVTDGAAAGTDQDKEYKPRAPRQPRQRGPPEDGIPSKNKVMVANLPYDLSEEKLKELFTEYKPTAAKIALRPIPRFMVRKLQARGEARKGRGFGFVSLESEDMQQKAVSEMNGKEIEGREIAVKVAIDSPGKEDQDLEGNVDATLKDAGASTLKENGVTEETPAATA